MMRLIPPAFCLSFVLLTAVLSVSMPGCNLVRPARDTATLRGVDEDALDTKRQWIARAGRLLRKGREVKAAEMAQLETLDRPQIVDKLMSDPAFIVMALDFNHIFLGRAPPQVNQATSLPPLQIGEFGDVPGLAWVSAAELAASGDYLAILGRGKSAFFLRRIGETAASEFDDVAGDDIDAGGDGAGAAGDVDKAALKVAALQPLEKTAAALSTGNGPQATDAACKELSKWTVGAFERYPMPADLLQHLRARFEYDDDTRVCIEPRRHASIATHTRAVESAVRHALDRSDELDAGEQPVGRQPFQGLAAALRFDGEALSLDPGTLLFDRTFYSQQQNSSTNFNRRRGAYVLRTFFCDDLTPLDIVAPDTPHGANAHATQPSCQACHYKLDPMAGFFRHRGYRGASFERQDNLKFDDGKLIKGAEREAYLDAWRAPSGSGRDWHVGYIRSPDPADADLNDYGETPADLMRIVAKAPESRRCLTQRLAEYVLGSKQIFDGGWVNSLARRFDEEPNSSVAFRGVVRDLVLSRTFAEPDPELGKCYDFAPSATASTLPCQVAYILVKKCVSCHKGEGAGGGLDLATWKTLADGKSGFRHLRSGAQVQRSETFKSIKDRLSTSNADLRMPLGQFMEAPVRAELFKWADEESAL